MDKLPEAVFIIDVGHEEIAVREATKLKVPVVAVVDTNCSPDSIDYPIPGNDDAMRAIQLYAAGIADAVIDGKASIPEVPRGDDEFVELDEEECKPKVGEQTVAEEGAGQEARPRHQDPREGPSPLAGRWRRRGWRRAGSPRAPKRPPLPIAPPAALAARS